jgi:hypothetical protein
MNNRNLFSLPFEIKEFKIRISAGFFLRAVRKGLGLETNPSSLVCR